MRQLQRLTHFLAAGLLLSGLSATMFAQKAPEDQNQRDRMTNQTTITGCLNKDASGTYTLTDEKTGEKTIVAGTPDLEKHSANHRVTLTGTTSTDPNGKSIFEVSKIKHMSASCKAESQ